MTVEERLGRIEERLDNIERNQSNHLEHHFRYTMYAWTTAIGLIITLIIMILKNVHL